MAMPIKDTPVLTGKNAERFLRIITENEHKRLSDEEMRSIHEAYLLVKSWIKNEKKDE